MKNIRSLEQTLSENLPCAPGAHQVRRRLCRGAPDGQGRQPGRTGLRLRRASQIGLPVAEVATLLPVL